MTGFVVDNGVESSIVDNPLSSTATTINITSGDGVLFPDTFPNILTLWDKATYANPKDDSGMEIIHVTGRSGDVLTVARGQENTVGVEHASGECIAMLITAGLFNDVTNGYQVQIDELDTGKLANIVEDTTPQLGGDLDGQGYGLDNSPIGVTTPSTGSFTNINYETMGSYYAPDATEIDQGAAGSGRSVKDYVDSIGSDAATLVFRHTAGGTETSYVFSTDETIPSNVAVIIEKGAVLTIGTGITVTINGAFDAGLYQVFGGDVIFGDGILDEVYPEWWGAKADNLDDSKTLNTTSIHAAIATGKKVKFAQGTYRHEGIVITDITCNHVHLEGAGMRKTILYCKEAEIDNISITAVNTYYSHPTITDMMIQGDGTNGNGIYGNGIVWYTFDRIYAYNNGKNGIKLIDTGTPAHGSYIGTIKRSKVGYNGEDGIYQVGDSGINQQNASYIQNVEAQGNVNGITIWGVNITVRDSIIEGNYGKGIRIQNFRTSGPIYSANGIVIDGCYFEENPDGHIYAQTNSLINGVIMGLTIKDNYGHQDITIPGIGYKSVHIDSASNLNEVRSLDYHSNEWGYTGGTPTVIADFGGYLSYNCKISAPCYSNTATLDSVIDNHVNLGLAKFDFLSSLVLHGYWDAKGGSDLTWSIKEKSDNITVSGANTYFKLSSIPVMARIKSMNVYVDTDATDYTITFRIYGRDPSSAPSYYSSLLNWTSTNLSGSNYVECDTTVYPYTRFELTRVDATCKVIVTLNTPGSYCYIGNPILYYR